MKNLKSTYKVLRTDVELDVKEISYLVNDIFYGNLKKSMSK